MFTKTRINFKKEKTIMAKNDEITLIIAKAFSRQPLTEKEKDICCELTVSKLVSDHCLNDIQAKLVIQWCALQKANIAYDPKDDLLNEGLFDNLFKRKSKKKDFDKIVKVHLEISSKVKDTVLGRFIFKANKLKNNIQSMGLSTLKFKFNSLNKHGNLLDRVLEDPKHEKQLSKEKESLIQLLDVIKFLNGIYKSFTEINVSSSRKVNEEATRQARQLDDLVALSKFAKTNYKNKKDMIYKKFISELVRTICRSEKIESSKEKNKLINSIKKYVAELHNDLVKIYKQERELLESYKQEKDTNVD